MSTATRARVDTAYQRLRERMAYLGLSTAAEELAPIPGDGAAADPFRRTLRPTRTIVRNHAMNRDGPIRANPSL